MEKKSQRKTGVGRRSFLSGSGLLLTGALLGASEETHATEEQTRIPQSTTPQDKDSLFADLVAANRIPEQQCKNRQASSKEKREKASRNR